MNRCCMLMLAIVGAALLQSAEAMLASKTPFKVNTFRISSHPLQNVTSVASQPGRTRVKFFEKVLGIRPGAPFEFSLDKWRAIQHCHLFHNITGRTFESEDGVVVEISAFENPSISVKPELSVGLSSSNPDISGGVGNQTVYI